MSTAAVQWVALTEHWYCVQVRKLSTPDGFATLYLLYVPMLV